MKKDIKNIEASVRGQLQNKAKETHRPFAEILQYFGMERFLYRLSRSEYANRFILKGALMFTVWHIPQRRTTLDIDFLARFDNQTTSIEKMVKDVCKTDVIPDGLIFDYNSVKGQRIKEDADYERVRVKFAGFLQRSRIPMQIDISFGDSILSGAKTIEYPVILDFPMPRLKGYPAESVVSEKFEAMVKLGAINSRMKDFYDIWLMMRQFDFDSSKLAEALKRTFTHRKTAFPDGRNFFAEDIYNEKSDRQTLWKAFLNKGDIKHTPQELSAVAKEIEQFLLKPLDAIKKEQRFNEQWTAPGAWR
ncbi:MAG: nucleotidyl transferase AbiEii/AbiGii toxin family protein [Nitrospirae bacterium]|nr:nucleotidyl transferase AbiEii/AbiGii toxin family protein [Nitrospirota bacterium]